MPYPLFLDLCSSTFCTPAGVSGRIKLADQIESWDTIIPKGHTRETKGGDALKRKQLMTDFPTVETGENVTRQVLADHPDMMVVAFNFAAKGAEGALHNHPHVQSTFVESGRFRFSMDGEEFEVGPGDSFVIPSDAVHGCICLEPGRLVDCFTPRRDDFL